MQLPRPVQRAIEDRAERISFPDLKRAAALLSDSYRQGKPARMNLEDRVAAYAVTRMPATYAAVRAVLAQLPDLPIATILDVGAGTGSASLAAIEKFPAQLTLMEREPALSEAARDWLPDAHIQTVDIATVRDFPPHDLVIAAWSLGELKSDITARLWDAARVAMIVIEPGTPAGAAKITEVRERLLALGAKMAAPCPAAMPCPMRSPDWCHFAARVERSSLHRKLKGGELGHEDEKFSYVAVLRAPATPATRIVRHPQHRPGLIELQLCTPQGLTQQRITKRDKSQFRAAREAAWGSAWEYDPT